MKIPSFRVMSHEWCWAVFFAALLFKVQILGLSKLPGILYVEWAAVLVTLGFAAKLVRLGETAQRCGWVLWTLSMNASFVLLGPTLKNLSPWRADGMLQRLDTILVGENLSIRAQAWLNTGLTDAMSTGYLFFMVLLLSTIVLYVVTVSRAHRFFTGLFSVYGLGFTGYTLLPAEGPYLAMKSAFTSAVHGGWVSGLNSDMVIAGSNHVDVFPSLHIAVSLFLWLNLMKDYRKVALGIAPLMVLLWTSTIYLRYHYFTDVIAGTLLALSMFKLSQTPSKAA